MLLLPTQTRPSQMNRNYRETMRGIRSFMGWSHIPDMDKATSTSDDNPFSGPKAHPAGKVSVTMPMDECLCSKMGKLNLTLTEGYPSRSSEAGGLLQDQFIPPPPPPPPGLRRNGMACRHCLYPTSLTSDFAGQSEKVGEISPRSFHHLQPSGWI